VRQGNRALRGALVQAANAAARTKHTYLSAQYRRLAARRGRKKAILAVAHSILVIAYHLIRCQEPYYELGGDYFDRRRPEVTAKRFVKRLEQLGFQVLVQQPQSTAWVSQRYFQSRTGNGAALGCVA
jgi:transposase